MPRTPTALLALLAGCGWNHLPTQDATSLRAPLWDADHPIATEDGVYFKLSVSDALALVSPDGSWSGIDLGAGELQGVSASPDLRTVAAFVTETTCPEGDEDAVYLRDCADEDREQQQVLVLVDAGATTAYALDNPYNGLRWSSEGRWAVALIEPGSDLSEVGGVVSLTTILFLDATTGTTTSIPVGFAATDVLFDAASERAVVLSQSEVAVVDLTSGTPDVALTYGLTLDADDVVVPVGVALTPDGEHALISVQGDDSLYILDLVNPSVNIKALSGAPDAMAVNDGEDRTVLVYGDEARVDVVDHDSFDVVSVTLDEPMSAIVNASNFTLLWSRDMRDVYRFQVVQGEDGAVSYDVTEYRLQATPFKVYLSPDEQFGVALTAPGAIGGRYGMEILDLRPDEDGGWRDDAWPYALEGRGLGVAFADEDGAPQALVLQDGIDYLYRFDLMSASATEIDLSAPPIAIGALPGGEFFITEDIGSGLVGWLEPTSEDVVEVAGFATFGMMGQDLLTIEED